MLYLVLYLMRWLCLPFMYRPCPMIRRPDWKVGVATTYVPAAESIEMLEETVRALVAMDYLHERWGLGEGDDDAEAKALCARLGAYHFSRKNLPQYHTECGPFERRSKHGNYNARLYEIGWLSRTGRAEHTLSCSAQGLLFSLLLHMLEEESGYSPRRKTYESAGRARIYSSH